MRLPCSALALLLLLAACGHRTSDAGKESVPPTAPADAAPQPNPAVPGNSSAAPLRSDSLLTLRGRVVVAHEVRSFIPAGDSTEYWLVDPSGALERQYDRVSGGATDGRPVDAQMELRYKGPSDEGFAAEYAGVFEVVRILSMERETEPKR